MLIGLRAGPQREGHRFHHLSENVPLPTSLMINPPPIISWWHMSGNYCSGEGGG